VFQKLGQDDPSTIVMIDAEDYREQAIVCVHEARCVKIVVLASEAFKRHQVTATASPEPAISRASFSASGSLETCLAATRGLPESKPIHRRRRTVSVRSATSPFGVGGLGRGSDLTSPGRSRPAELSSVPRCCYSPKVHRKRYVTNPSDFKKCCARDITCV
jgi:hypothetical protein